MACLRLVRWPLALMVLATGLSWQPAVAAPQTIVWARRVYEKTGRSYLQVWQARSDGTGAKAITKESKDHFWPALSPDGTSIAYLTREDDGQALWVARRYGQKARRLSSPDTSVFGWLTWSPDSRTLIASRNGDTSPAWEVTSSHARAVAPAGCEAEGGVSPSGRWEASVTGTRDGKLMLADRQKETNTKLLDGSFITPLWRPGQDLLAVSLLIGSPDAQPPQIGLHLIDAASGKDTTVAVPEALRKTWCQSYWSPRGRYLVVIAWRDRVAGGGEIWLYDLPNNAWLRVGEGRQARVSPEETQVLYVTNLTQEEAFGKQLEASHLVLYDIAAQRMDRLTQGAEVCENPGWGPQ